MHLALPLADLFTDPHITWATFLGWYAIAGLAGLIVFGLWVHSNKRRRSLWLVLAVVSAVVMAVSLILIPFSLHYHWA